MFVELDVGSLANSNDQQIRSVLYSVVKEGAIASYVTSVQGFQFRRLGEGKTTLERTRRRHDYCCESVLCTGGRFKVHLCRGVSLTVPSGF